MAGNRAAEQWRDGARKVPGVLLRVASSESEAVLGCIASAHQWLRSQNGADLYQAHRAALHGAHPEVPSDASLGSVVRLAALHDTTGKSFAFCAARLGVITVRGNGVDAETQRVGHLAEAARLVERGYGVDAETQVVWKTWLTHRAEAARHADEARRRLRSAVLDLVAAHRVLFVIAGRPPGSPPVVYWTSEAERLLRRAVDEAIRRMRDTVFLEFFVAWMLLSHLDARAGQQPAW